MSIQKNNNELIITIVNRGFSEDVMDAAREVGAPGGTILHGRGTGAGHAEFYNMVLHEEKEAVLIVADKAIRNNIMEAIMKVAGQATEAQGIVFTVPVEEFVVLTKNQSVNE